MKRRDGTWPRRCAAIKITFHKGVMHCTRVEGHEAEHFDFDKGEMWA